MAMKTYTKKFSKVFAVLLTGAILPFSLAANEVASVSGTVTLSVAAGTVAAPTYEVASIGIAGEPTYKGAVTSVSGNVLTFSTSTDSDNNTVNPFTPNALAAGVANLKATISGANAVNAITDLGGAVLSNTNTEGSGLDDSNPPTITIEDPDSGEDVATATATVSGGKITGISITNGGAGYTSAPSVSVACGPHFVRLVEEGSSNKGRVFLVTANTATTVTLSNPNSENLASIFAGDYSVEIVRASTLGEVFGTETALVGSGNAYSADFVYLWNQAGVYTPYYHFPGSGRKPKGWYNRLSRSRTPSNDTVVWPDEGFILARRTNSALNIEMDGIPMTTDQKMQLPAAGGQFVMNNPYGVDILLCELISPSDVGDANTQFKPGTTGNDGTDGDNVYILSGNAWSKYWYEDGVNDAVTAVATASAKTPGGGSMTTADVSLAAGTVTGLATCNSSGGTAGVDHNESEYTKVSISGTVPAAGFTITFSDVRGRKLNENGDKEEDEDGVEVNNGSGVSIESTISGSFTVIASGGGYVVVKKRRNVNFVSAGSSPVWSTGDGGAGYSGNAKVYFMGGGGKDGEGTATVSAGKVTGITVTNGGEDYPEAGAKRLLPGRCKTMQ